MIITADILAEGDSLVGFLVLVLFVAISIIGSVAKKKQEQKAAEQRRPPRQDGPPPPPGQRAAEPQQRPATEVQRQSLVAAALKSMGIEVPTQQPKAPPKPKVAPQRVKPKPQPKKPEALGDGIQQHVQEHLQMPKARRVRAEATGTTVRLTAKTARRAMIYHEIFSPPKALRTGGEMWDPA